MKNHAGDTFISNRVFQMVFFQITKRHSKTKNSREDLLSRFWFLDIMSAVGHNIAQTIFDFLSEVLRDRRYS